MFSWLVEEEQQTPLNKDVPELKSFRIERLYFNDVPTKINELGQFFTAASFLLAENTMVQLPASDKAALELIKRDIAPHFINVKVVLVKGQVETIMMQHLKDSSIQMLQNLAMDGLHPVVLDLYRSKDMNLLGPHKPQRRIRTFKVRNELLDTLSDLNSKGIQQFVERAYFSKGDSLALSPTGWKFNDEIQHSITLQMFSKFVPHIKLLVDADDLNVIGLDLSPS
jgi:hypothetical protein